MPEEFIPKDSMYTLIGMIFCDDCAVRYGYGSDGCLPGCCVSKLKDAVFDLPAEDVRRNNRGHWLDFSVSASGASSARCSQCGTTLDINSWSWTPLLAYCPCCGADMRKCGENHE